MKLAFSTWLVLFSFLFLAGAHTITNYILTTQTTVAEELQINNEAVMQAESNLFARWFLKAKSTTYVLQYIIVPGLLFGTYFAMRRWNTPANTDHYALAVFWISLLDVLNDASILLGYFAHATA